MGSGVDKRITGYATRNGVLHLFADAKDLVEFVKEDNFSQCGWIEGMEWHTSPTPPPDLAGEQLQHALDAGLALAAERDRLRAGLEMLAQCRHVSGSAQGAFRSNLAIADAVLAGADVRDFATVDAITKGTWRPTEKTS